MSFGSNHPFTSPWNSHDVFSLSQKIGQGLQTEWQQLAHLLLFFYCPVQCQVLKAFPYYWDWSRIWKASLSHIPPSLERLPYSTWTGGIGVWSTTGHFKISFFQSHANVSYRTYNVLGQNLPRNELLWGWCIQSVWLRLELWWSFYLCAPLTCCCCLVILGKWVRILSPFYPLPQLPIPLISEGRWDFFVSIFSYMRFSNST